MARTAAISKLDQSVSEVIDEIQRALRPLVESKAESEGDKRGATTLFKLYSLVLDRGKATLLLLRNGMPWDAEIVLRALYEAAFKIELLCLAPQDQKSTLLREYWDADVHHRRTRARAAVVEEHSKPSHETVSAIFNFLRTDDVTPINAESTRAERSAVEQRWSFTGILAFLNRNKPAKPALPDTRLLLHAYGMASHFVHSDCCALDLLLDRATREPKELGLLEDAHASRIIIDTLSMTYCPAVAISLHFDAKLENWQKISNEVKRCVESIEPLSTAFYESQKALYEKYGYKFSVDSPSS